MDRIAGARSDLSDAPSVDIANGANASNCTGGSVRQWNLLGGDEAARLSADAEARGHYEKAINALAGLPDTVENRRRRVDTTLKRAAVSYIADRPDLNLARLAVAEALAGSCPP
jgi:predicted ATPase